MWPRLPVFLITRSQMPAERGQPGGLSEPIVFATLHRQLLEQLAPPSLLVSPDDKVVHLSDGVERYLVLPGGEVTMNLYKVVREELRIDLRGALHTATKSPSSLSFPAICKT